MKNQLLNHLAHCALLLLVGLGACEPAEPEVAIDGVIRAQINGQAWESAHITWGGVLPAGISYPGSGFSPLQIFVKGTNGSQNEIGLGINGRGGSVDGTDNIFSQRGKLSELWSSQELRFDGEIYYGQPTDTQMEILSADTLTRTIEGRFSFRGYCCPGGQVERAVSVTDGYFKLTFP
jgi:hypothetical protein